MIANRDKDGNFTVKIEEDDRGGRESTLVKLIWELQDNGCELSGDEYCIGNALGMAIDMYDCYTDKTIFIPYADVEKLENDETITFYAR